jgi:hypothetical protein
VYEYIRRTRSQDMTTLTNPIGWSSGSGATGAGAWGRECRVFIVVINHSISIRMSARR